MPIQAGYASQFPPDSPEIPDDVAAGFIRDYLPLSPFHPKITPLPLGCSMNIVCGPLQVGN
ncbi:MAG: hypothetical protein JW944_02645, partial [Deltaproteobacteria bacterium]|nr:hypothetical protein [Deltaproteobacteria bacterium]